jgi:uncharacterized protein (DUF169 family)
VREKMENRELLEATQRLTEMIPLRAVPLAFFYADGVPEATKLPTGERTCVVAMLAHARKGATVAISRDNFGCGGAGYYLGFCPPRPEIAEFVSTGIPGKMEGEHYKQSPDLVRAYQAHNPVRPAPADYAVCKPVAALAATETPEVIVCLGTPDELSALLGLANYAREDEAVITPFGSGCNSLFSRPLREAAQPQPRAVLGLFDPSARPYVGSHELSFAAPLAVWEEMVSNAGESFLRTATWAVLRRRIERG